jgi:hypothetical protein
VLRLSTLKALGVFSTLAAIVPIRMQNLYKELTDQGIIKEVCEFLRQK